MASGRHRERQGSRPTATQSAVGKGIRTRIRSASCVDNRHRMLRQMQASSTGRERGRCINWGLGKSLFSGSRLCPPPFTSTRHVTRERGLGGVAPKSGAPFCAARAGRAHAVARSFSSRLCSSSCQCSPVCERRCLCSHFWRYVDDHFLRFEHRNTTLDTGSTLPWLNPSDRPGLHPDATALTTARADTRTLRLSPPSPLMASLIAPDGLPHRPFWPSMMASLIAPDVDHLREACIRHEPRLHRGLADAPRPAEPADPSRCEARV
jgi:hypothetical protein